MLTMLLLFGIDVWFTLRPPEKSRAYVVVGLVMLGGLLATISRGPILALAILVVGLVCLRFMSAGQGLSAWGASGSLTVSLPAAMREQMLAYARREGPVDVSLDPICAPLLCQPD